MAKGTAAVEHSLFVEAAAHADACQASLSIKVPQAAHIALSAGMLAPVVCVLQGSRAWQGSGRAVQAQAPRVVAAVVPGWCCHYGARRAQPCGPAAKGDRQLSIQQLLGAKLCWGFIRGVRASKYDVWVGCVGINSSSPSRVIAASHAPDVCAHTDLQSPS
jgi:hypothetical protein